MGEQLAHISAVGRNPAWQTKTRCYKSASVSDTVLCGHRMDLHGNLYQAMQSYKSRIFVKY
jgi:hypothetical protein